MEILRELFKAFLPGDNAFFFMWLLASLGLTAFAIAFERWWDINRRTDVDAPGLYARVKEMIDGGRLDDAYALCAAGERRALPRVLAAGIGKARIEPRLAGTAMGEESTHMFAVLEKRLSYLVMFGNVFTLFGLLGTVYGLIMSFQAVSKPDVAAIEKSSLLAAGISAAMNSTLLGLTLSVICVITYAFLRAKVDAAMHTLDRYAVSTLKTLDPEGAELGGAGSMARHGSEDEDVADADVTPMLNLMVMLIPVLLTSSEFVKDRALELKLPEAAGGAGGGGDSQQQDVKLNLGVAITAKGFTLFHSFKKETKVTNLASDVDIPLKAGEYDYEALNRALGDVKKQALQAILQANRIGPPSDTSLVGYYARYLEAGLQGVRSFSDHENIKIVAEEKVKYQTVVAVMDAARGMRSPKGATTMFPNVSIAGGIVQ